MPMACAHDMPGLERDHDTVPLSPRPELTAVFVYGTLCSGGAHAALLDHFALKREPAYARGDVREAGRAFPAARFDTPGSRMISGELVWLDPDSLEEAFAQLDRYEGNLFHRVVVTVTTESGRTISAHAYEWSDEIDA